MAKIRTRFAPSPTGRMHVGNLRTALYTYLIAKHEGGDFVLRIEDTDQGRYCEEALGIIYRTLEKTGLKHDEGPDKDGGFGPYVQSERVASGLYMDYAKQLIEKGEAYYCFCDQERLDSLKQNVGGKEISVYDKHCLHLSKEEVEANLAAGKPFVIRANMPNEGETTFHDEIYGDITQPNEELDDMILIKSDGYPTYNFANVVDDHLMQITHVVRGNEYLSSAPKYTRLYKAFGWEEPKYIHCPLITNEEHQKLSKRSGHSSYEDLIEQGFVPEAVVNFVALLGWSSPDNREIFSLEELVEAFDYKHISKSPAVFDMVKLKWMNGEYLKAMDSDTFYNMAEPYIKEVIKKDMDLKKIAALVKTRIEVFPEIGEMIDFFEAVPEYDVDMYTNKKNKTNAEKSLPVLQELLPVIEAQEDFTNDALYQMLRGFADEKGYKPGFVMWPVRTAVSGKRMTPGGATEIMEIIGKDETVSRYLKHCIFEEIVPTLGNTQTDIDFGKAVLERFANPFIRHMLLSIALNSVSKFQVRVLPTILEHKEKFGKYPEGLVMSMAALIAFYRTDKANDGAEIMEFMKTASVEDIMKREDYWHADLTEMIPMVQKYYDVIEKDGMKAAYDLVLNK